MSVKVCHDGNGNILNEREPGAICVSYHDQAPGGVEQHDRVKETLKLAPYIKWDSRLGEPVEMTQAEKDAYDAAKAQETIDNAKSEAKSQQDAQDSTARYLRAIVKLTVDQVNILRSQHGLSQITYDQAKTAINNLVDGE